MVHSRLRLLLAPLSLVAALGMLYDPTPAYSQGAETNPVQTLLLAVRANQSPETAASGPFHLQATFTTSDTLGKEDGTGTLEAFWDGKTRWRHTVTYRGMTQTVVEDNGIYRSKEAFKSSFSQRLVLHSLFSPVPYISAEEAGSGFEIQPQTMGSEAMECVTSKAPHGAAPGTVPDPVAYCISSKSKVLRMTYMPGRIGLYYNQLQLFGTTVLAGDIALMQGKTQRAHLLIQSIAKWQPDDATFTHPPGSEKESPEVLRPAALMATSIVEKTQPVFPPIAKSNHVSGTVTLAIVITPQGTVTDAEVISSPDLNLAGSALEAVRHWRYRPPVVNSTPVQVETTVSITFGYGG